MGATTEAEAPDSARATPAGAASEGARTAAAVPIEADQPDRFTIDTSLVVDQDVTIMARMSGVVEEIFADRGSRVRKGDPLLKLMNRDLGLLLKRAEITAKQRRAEFERARRLFEERAIAPSQFEEIELLSEAAEMDVEIAREELEKSFVRAPFDGLIIDRFARVGQKVIEERNEPLFRITTLSPLLARLYLPEEAARSLRRGDRVEVIPRHLSQVSATGTIDWISRVIDASSGTAQAIVSVSGREGAGSLSPGTAVTIVLRLPAAQAGVLIPRSALGGHADAPNGGLARVEVLEDGNRSWRTIRVGGVRGDSVEIVEGLRPGERVVLIDAQGAERVENR
jgi:RND family efflux transporter MFP subunit